jgi:hypothetical protein
VPKPQVRIVHQGGPASLVRVFVGDEQLLSVSKVELVLDANDHSPASARLTIHDVDLDLVADLGAVQSQTRGVAWGDVVGARDLEADRALASGGVISGSGPIVVGEGAGCIVPPRMSAEAAWALAPTDHAHSFPRNPDVSGAEAAGDCDCGLTWDQYKEHAAYYMRTGGAVRVIVSDGGDPEISVPADAPSGYITPRDLDATDG